MFHHQRHIFFYFYFNKYVFGDYGFSIHSMQKYDLEILACGDEQLLFLCHGRHQEDGMEYQKVRTPFSLASRYIKDFGMG